MKPFIDLIAFAEKEAIQRQWLGCVLDFSHFGSKSRKRARVQDPQTSASGTRCFVQSKSNLDGPIAVNCFMNPLM
jgi:hypothetical protein